MQEDGKGSKELKRLQFYGAGPKMAGFDKASPEDSGKTRGKKVDYSDQDPVSFQCNIYICLHIPKDVLAVCNAVN